MQDTLYSVTNSDAFAVGVVLDGTGQEIAVKFWKGGKEYRHHCRKLLEKIQKSQEATGGRQTGRVDQKYWMHLKHLSEHYGHQVTSQILRFAVEQDVSVIVLPRYNQEYSRNVMKGSGNWGPLHLSTRIRQYLDYKAWKNGSLLSKSTPPASAKFVQSVVQKSFGLTPEQNYAAVPTDTRRIGI